MAGNFTPAKVLIGVPGPKGEKGEDGSGGGPHTHPEYEHNHPYAADPHTHPEFTHTHDYAASGHTHSYAAVVHSHDYAATGHTHDTSHNHDGSYSGLGHTHDYAATGHNHDGVYAPTHAHPYADASHGIHPDPSTWTGIPVYIQAEDPALPAPQKYLWVDTDTDFLWYNDGQVA